MKIGSEISGVCVLEEIYHLHKLQKNDRFGQVETLAASGPTPSFYLSRSSRIHVEIQNAIKTGQGM